MKKIETILFDLGGVLIDYSIEICAKSFRKLGYPQADQIINPYQQGGVLQLLESGKITPDEFHREIIRAIGHPVDPQAIDQALCSFLLEIPDYKLDLLLDLRRQGYQVWMLSNTNAIMFDFIKASRFRKQGLTLDDYFDRIFLSYEMGVMKPAPAIFNQMIAQTNLNPSTCLFIDDGEANINTATSLGFNTYLAAPREDFSALFSNYQPISH